MILFDEKYLNISLISDYNILKVKWMGFTTSEEFRKGIDLIISLMIEHDVQKTLTDVSEHKAIGTEDQEYATQRSVEFSRTQWKVRRAIISPKDVFARFGLKQVNNRVAKEEQQERQLFDDEQEAIRWLNGAN